ncbi:C6 zinc finger domain-containing protein [Stagonosporopsis vannaccii]|nr:C6 zinc finger domain-containing protein [Stagonosporopsis vannaccii]
MNFVDVQPKSFLDYAWTSPTPPAMSTPKPSKTNRKQNRCCDQCRKGKRACDAAILEDSLLDASKSGDHPSVFHYSDVYGPLAACGNCEKTKKNCTFEWLRSQRVSQASQPPSHPAPPAKRRRTNSNTAVPPESTNGPPSHAQAESACRSNTGEIGNPMNPGPLGVMFGDFPGLPADRMENGAALWYDSVNALAKDGLVRFNDVLVEDATPSTCDSGRGSSLETPPSNEECTTEERRYHRVQRDEESSGGEMGTKLDSAVMRTGRKRRRRSSSVSLSNGALPCPAISFAAEFVSSANKALLREGLLKIYHDSFENALSCWLTERTCPYSTKADISLANDGGPDWNRMYHRVFRLDRLASSIRGRQLTFLEDKSVGRALNSAIFSFATQWAQSSERSRAKYPFDHSPNPGIFASQNKDSSWSSIEFDRTLQIDAWNEARVALQDAGDIESFRLVLAQIVFSLTQRPRNLESNFRTATEHADMTDLTLSGGDSVEQCEDLMSRLNLAIEAEGAPVHLEKGVRLIHALRSRMTMRAGTAPLKPRSNRRGRQYKPAANAFDAADRATVDLLFWLGVMFDTLSSAMHKRPLVLSDEDSNVYANETRTAADSTQRDAESVVSRSTEGVWDIHLFAHQRDRLQRNLVRWPCSFEEAAALLCDAAPVKVLLFRKVTRIQTLLSRNCHGEKIERAVKAALSVCEHWEKLYAPFIRDCVQHHDSLPPRIQSWYICLTGHWHLATLLLADLIEIVDDSGFGLETQQMLRTSTEFVACYRKSNCRALADLARCSCPREDASFAQSGDFHFAVNEGALLTEPWTAVLIRAFAKAGVVLLETDCLLSSFSMDCDGEAEKAFREADDCVQALWYLGRKSDMALSAARILGDELKQKRQGAEEKLKEMSAYLEAETWHSFDQVDEVAGWGCSF